MLKNLIAILRWWFTYNYEWNHGTFRRFISNTVGTIWTSSEISKLDGTYATNLLLHKQMTLSIYHWNPRRNGLYVIYDSPTCKTELLGMTFQYLLLLSKTRLRHHYKKQIHIVNLFLFELTFRKARQDR